MTAGPVEIGEMSTLQAGKCTTDFLFYVPLDFPNVADLEMFVDVFLSDLRYEFRN